MEYSEEEKEAAEKAAKIFDIIMEHTMPKEQFGFFTEDDLAKLIWDVMKPE